MPSPKKLSHLVAPNQPGEAMIEWYCKVLGAQLLHQNKQIAFISYDDEHHGSRLRSGSARRQGPRPRARRRAPARGRAAPRRLHDGLADELADQYIDLKERGSRRTAASITA